MKKLSASTLLQAAEQILLPHQEAAWILAVSGGVDSSVMLYLVQRLVSEKRLQPKKIQVLHINHGLRGVESDGDEALVRAKAAELGLPFLAYRLAWKKGETPSQNTCRRKREEIYAALIKKVPGTKILLAHNANDQAETIFQRLLRGTGVRGLQGMTENDGYKLRPLLFISRSQIQSVAKIEKIGWREDSSNAKSDYERNWLRNEIFPLLEKRRPGFSFRLGALSSEVRQLEKKKKTKLPEAARAGEKRIFLQSDLAKMSTEELSRLFQLSRNHAVALQMFLRKKNAGFYPLPQSLCWLSCGYVLFSKEQNKEDAPFPLTIKEGTCGESILGRWVLERKNSKTNVLLEGATKSDSLKKLLGKKQVPGFFRKAIPLVKRKGKKEALVPREFHKPAQWKSDDGVISYMPSAFSLKLLRAAPQFLSLVDLESEYK